MYCPTPLPNCPTVQLRNQPKQPNCATAQHINTNNTMNQAVIALPGQLVTGSLHQRVKHHVLKLKVCRHVLAACKTRWCGLTVSWATRVLSCAARQRRCKKCHHQLALYVVSQAGDSGTDALVAALDVLETSEYKIPDAYVSHMQALARQYVTHAEIMNQLARWKYRHNCQVSQACLAAAPVVISRLDQAHNVHILSQVLLGCPDCGDKLRQQVATYGLEQLAHWADQPSEEEYYDKFYYDMTVNIDFDTVYYAREAMLSCAKADALPDQVLARFINLVLKGRPYGVLYELAVWQPSFGKVFCDAFVVAGPAKLVQHMLFEDRPERANVILLACSDDVVQFVQSVQPIRHPDPRAPRQYFKTTQSAKWFLGHPAWQCLAIAVCDKLATSMYPPDSPADEAVLCILVVNQYARQAFVDHNGVMLAKQIVADHADLLDQTDRIRTRATRASAKHNLCDGTCGTCGTCDGTCGTCGTCDWARALLRVMDQSH